MYADLRKPGHSKAVPGESQVQYGALVARTGQMSASYSTGHFRLQMGQIAESAMILAPMPSPIGHALAGLASAWAADLVPGNRSWRTAPESASWFRRAGNGLTLICVGLGAAADLDHLFVAHRTVTHSVGALALIGLLAAALAANTHRPMARIALMCAAAYGTHLLLDWLGVDMYPPRGLQLLWPVSREWYISGLDVFRQTARQELLTPPIIRKNLLAIVQEVAILGPVVVALWLIRVKALARLAPEVPRRDHAPQ
jgi:membrane-bound metal-dependent hydrolase YbcI (DUF457 family)